jgi:hypothetical protein
MIKVIERKGKNARERRRKQKDETKKGKINGKGVK